MKLLIALLISIWLVGCDGIHVETRYRCVDGKIYVLSGGIWISAELYKDNKCLPIEESK